MVEDLTPTISPRHGRKGVGCLIYDDLRSHTLPEGRTQGSPFYDWSLDEIQLFNIDVLRVPDLGGYGRLRNRDHNLAQLSIPLPHLKGHKLHHRFMMVPFPGGTLLDGWYMDGERSVRLVLNIGGP